MLDTPQKLPFGISNRSLRDMKVTLTFGAASAEVVIPAGGRIILAKSFGAEFRVGFAGLDEPPLQAVAELNIDESDR